MPPAISCPCWGRSVSRCFPTIDDSLAPVAAATTMFDPVRVKWLQTALNLLGADPPLDVDGEYGPDTKTAVQRFQETHGLVADGWAGDRRTRRCSLRSPRQNRRRRDVQAPAQRLAQAGPGLAVT